MICLKYLNLKKFKMSKRFLKSADHLSAISSEQQIRSAHQVESCYKNLKNSIDQIKSADDIRSDQVEHYI